MCSSWLTSKVTMFNMTTKNDAIFMISIIIQINKKLQGGKFEKKDNGNMEY